MNEFCLGFHWSLFLRFQLMIFQHGFRKWLGAYQATSHYLNQWWLVYWCIYASLSLNELKVIFEMQIHSSYSIPVQSLLWLQMAQLYPNSARPSAGTVLIANWICVSSKCYLALKDFEQGLLTIWRHSNLPPVAHSPHSQYRDVILLV